MIGRLWYPQLDVYDAIRRMAGLLSLWSYQKPPSPERLFVTDFYLANPPLLHNTHMQREVRKRFSKLGISRPEKQFVVYPSAPLLFQKMDAVQRQAYRTLSGKGLLDRERLEQGEVIPSQAGDKLFGEQFLPLFEASELTLCNFLITDFAPAEISIAAVRRSTGLRRLAR